VCWSGYRLLLRDILSTLARPLTAVTVLFKATAMIMLELPFAQSSRSRLSSTVVQVFRCGRFIRFSLLARDFVDSVESTKALTVRK